MRGKTCKVDGCGARSRALGMCQKHYRRFKVHGNVNQSTWEHSTTCSVDGCNSGYYSKGFCRKHYEEDKLSRDPDWRKPRTFTECKMPDCEKAATGLGYCHMHYARVRKHGDPNADFTRRRGTCSVDGCGKPHVAKGYCEQHYRAVTVHGDPNHKFNSKRHGNTELPCTNPDCDNRRTGNQDYCQRCYDRLRRYGNLDFAEPNPETCTRDGCNRPYHASGLCKNCYQLRDPEKNRLQAQSWRDRNRDHVRAKSREYRIRNPEVELESKKRMFERQGAAVDMDGEAYRMALFAWSLAVRKRDGNRCGWCGSRSNLHSHHVLPKSIFPEHALDVSNGFTVCRTCHEEIHRIVGRHFQ